ncbi:glycine zipper 2TM domain-containing protein [Sphingomonas sp.]|uniref:glycine zipper 2TM domain-containing protein n=1 Tax=Sphingomonas sp. TaxID=28214 RepID=UPI003AFFCE89
MRTMMLAMALTATAATGVAVEPATAQYRDDRGSYDRSSYDRGGYDRGDHGWHGDRNGWNPRDDYRRGNYRARRMGRDDQVYRGRDGRYYCKRNDGTTGLVIGAVGGGVAGNLLGGGTLGTLLGAGGGALLGRSIDRGNVKCR